MSENTKSFLKPSLRLDDQIALLKTRELVIENLQRLYLRILSAYHMRIRNRLFTVKPAIAKKFKLQLQDNHRFYAFAVIPSALLQIIADGSQWHQRLHDLFHEYDDLPKNEMGFPENWQLDPFWRIGT